TFSSRLSSSARHSVFIGDFAVRGFQLLHRRVFVVSPLSSCSQWKFVISVLNLKFVISDLLYCIAAA
ncbi:hypothetical protein HN873_012283, partial [Arachis hypogaea]